jgi:hypothetical protein
MTRSVYLFMPTYTGQPKAETFHWLVREIEHIKRRGWTVHVRYSIGDAYICRARNYALAAMYNDPAHYTDFVQVDDDVQPEEGALVRLLSHECDVVAGVYPKRMEPLQFPCKPVAGAHADANGLLEMELVPTGFLRITRGALDKMIAAYPERMYADNDVAGAKAWAFFMVELVTPANGGPNELWGEDFTFCRLWREAGGKIFADTLLAFRHIGRKAYEGCYALDRLAGPADDLSPRTPTQSAA